MYKSSNIKYCKLPAKVYEEIPRNKLFVVLINHVDNKLPNVSQRGKERNLTLKAVTLPQYNDKHVISITNLLNS